MSAPNPTLVDPREETYFTILLVVSILVWLGLILTCFAIFYVLLIGFFLWLGHGLLVARLRSEGVEVTPEQEPALHHALVETCGRLGLTTIPRLYILQEGGLLNAFTTRHSSRQFIVIYSDMLEACGSDSPEVRFVLGHEIGHIQRNHVLKSLFLLPGRIMPLIGDAYSRACERTCDRYGAAGANDVDGAVRAMMMLSAGRLYGRTLAPEKFAAQHFTERGFFVSWHELTSAYPTLSQRVTNLLALKGDAPPPLRPKRHPLAYVFALFTLSGPGGGFSSLLLTIFVVAIFASLALPAFTGALKKGQEVRAAQVEKQRTADIIARGAIDSSLVGTWKGKADDLRWTTYRHADGRYDTDYEEGTGEDQENYRQSGQWRTLNGVYYELPDRGENREYPLRGIEADRAIFGEAEEAGGNSFIEMRQP